MTVSEQDRGNSGCQGSTRLVNPPATDVDSRTQNDIVCAKRSHPVICLVALAAYLLNLIALAGGAVLCQDPAGESSIEFACDHDHCAATVETEHDHDSGGCWCSSCPCDDTPLTMDVAPVPKDDDVRASTPNSRTFVFVQRFEREGRTTNRVLLADRLPPALDPLRQLRTVVLIV